MKDNKANHSCVSCKYFCGWDEIRTLERELLLDIPICGNRIYSIALTKCEHFIFKPCPSVNEGK